MYAFSGAITMLEQDRIDVLQFEFGGVSFDSLTYFGYLLELLSPGFDLNRILRYGLYRIGSYHERLELFSCINYLALRRSV